MERKSMYSVSAKPTSTFSKLANANLLGKPVLNRITSAANALAKNPYVNKPVAEELIKEKPAQGIQAEIRFDMNYTGNNVKLASVEPMVSQERLQDAIIWSEILGKPVSKRRKRRI